MQPLTSSELRRRFREFFVARGHTVVPSSPLAPLGDPTLLFTTAGMVQFKPYFGQDPERLPYRRAVSIQKCLRLTDVDNVGRTPRHDTFFEMLGNFSFGDYFKREAIEYAWDFSTRELGLPADRLYVTVFNGEGGQAPPDEEARAYWRGVGVPDDHIFALGRADNFWGPAGGTGACGPSSEIYYDLGPEACTCDGTCSPGSDCPRYMEYWNNVFPQYDAQADGSMPLLARPGIDTGMGLERLALIVQGCRRSSRPTCFSPWSSRWRTWPAWPSCRRSAAPRSRRASRSPSSPTTCARSRSRSPRASRRRTKGAAMSCADCSAAPRATAACSG
jgi:alanyl-tRNA synthetase